MAERWGGTAHGQRVEPVVQLWAAGRRQLRAHGSLYLKIKLVPSAHSLADAVWRDALAGRPHREPAVTG